MTIGVIVQARLGANPSERLPPNSCLAHLHSRENRARSEGRSSPVLGAERAWEVQKVTLGLRHRDCSSGDEEPAHHHVTTGRAQGLPRLITQHGATPSSTIKWPLRPWAEQHHLPMVPSTGIWDILGKRESERTLANSRLQVFEAGG